MNSPNRGEKHELEIPNRRAGSEFDCHWLLESTKPAPRVARDTQRDRHAGTVGYLDGTGEPE